MLLPDSSNTIVVNTAFNELGAFPFAQFKLSSIVSGWKRVENGQSGTYIAHERDLQLQSVDQVAVEVDAWTFVASKRSTFL